MRNVRRILMLLLAVVMSLAATATAAAKRPPKEPPTGRTCEWAKENIPNIDHAEEVWSEDGSSFTVVLDDSEGACVDVASDGPWDVEVSFGSADGVSVTVGDSVAPGEACWTWYGEPPPDPFLFETPPIEAVVDACGDAFPDGDPSLVFLAGYDGKRRLAEPVTITVTP